MSFSFAPNLVEVWIVVNAKLGAPAFDASEKAKVVVIAIADKVLKEINTSLFASWKGLSWHR